MLRYLIILLLTGILLCLGYFIGLGLYLGRDVPSGLSSIARSLVSDNLVTGPQQMIAAADVPVHFREVRWMGELESAALGEASGLVASGRQPGVLFSVNDSGNEPRLFALSQHGEHIASYRIDYNERHDFEALAGFELDGEAYILIADTGDNLYWRPELTLLVVREPEPGQTPDDALLGIAWQVSYAYPDGYRDVEAVAVDPASESVLLLSKRHVPSEVYQVPLKSSGPVTAALIARLTGIPQPEQRDLLEDPRWGRYRSTITGVDLRGRKAVVITYKDAYLYQRSRRQSWAEAFSGIPTRLPLPAMYGLESGAIDSQENYLYVLGEREDGTGRAGVFRAELP